MKFDELSLESKTIVIYYKNKKIDTDKFEIDYNSDGSIKQLLWRKKNLTIPALIFHDRFDS